MRPVRRLAVLVVLAAAATPARPQGPAARRETVMLPFSATATRRLSSALELIAARQWDAALGALSELETRHAGELVEVSPRRALSAPLAARVIRAQLPDEALAALRRTIDAPAQEQLAAALRTGDRSLLLRLVEQSLASSSGDDAIAALAERAWEEGQLDHAAALWSLLDASAPPADQVIDPSAPLRVPTDALTPADLAARQILVNLFERDFLRAAEQQREFATKSPDAAGHLASRDGALHEILQSVREEARGWPLPMDATRWEINGGPSRNAATAGNAAPGARVWSVPFDSPASLPQVTRTPLLRARGTLASVPAVDGTRVFVQDERGIRAHRVEDGRPLWPTGASDDDGTIFGGASGDAPPLPVLPAVGQPVFAPSVEEGRLFAHVGWPISVAGSQEPRPLESRLIALDVDRREGKLLWSRTPVEALPPGEWRFSGPPLAAGDRVYVAARKARPEMAVGIACLDCETGETAWFQTIFGLLDEAPATFHRVTQDVLTFSPGRILLACDCGATACLDAATGRVQWLALDDPLPWTPANGSPGDTVSLRPAVVHRGVAYTVQHDDRTVQALDLATGAALWSAPLPSRIAQLVGVRGGLLFASGDQLWGLDIDNGSVRWRFGFDDVEGKAHGQALIAGPSVLWPTQEELFEVDLATGLPVRRILTLPDAAGNLSAAPGRLLMAGPRRLSAVRIEMP
jgi:outer membrane protein assembly factor BamB